MNLYKRWMVVPAILALSALTYAGAAKGSTPVIELIPGFSPDPIALSGISGGTKQTTPDCGKIAAIPNHTIAMSKDFPYLRFTLRSTGQPTLSISEPNGHNTCILGDSLSGGIIQAPGYWKQGTYRIYIGDRAGGHNPYTLSITQKSQ